MGTLGGADELNPGEVLKEAATTKRGNLDQYEGEAYDVVDAQGHTVGKVTYTSHFDIRPPFNATCWVVQKDIDGNAVVNKRV